MTDAPNTTGPKTSAETDEKYRGPDADARAAAIEATLGTDAENLVDTVWLLRYVGIKHNVKWPDHLSHDEKMENTFG